MDTKKANLTPELKEIYDRVMNTSTQPKPIEPTVPTPAPNLPPTPPTQQPITSQMPAQPTMPQLGTPQSSPQLTQELPNTQMQQPQLQEQPLMPSMPMVSNMSPAEEALTSTPARPLNEGNTFAMSGKAKNDPPKGTRKGLSLSKPILIVLGIAFIAIWGVFWAIVLGFIQR